MTTPPSRPHLTEMDRSRALGELDSMPRERMMRLRRDTTAGRMVTEPQERNIQVALLGQQRGLRAFSAALFPLIALLRVIGVLDGHDRRWFDILAAVGFVIVAVFVVRRWFLMRRLERAYGLTKESFR